MHGLRFRLAIDATDHMPHSPITGPAFARPYVTSRLVYSDHAYLFGVDPADITPRGGHLERKETAMSTRRRELPDVTGSRWSGDTPPTIRLRPSRIYRDGQCAE